MVRGHSFKRRARRGAFTLVELLMAATCTSIVAASATSLVFAIASASRTTKEIRAAKSTGNYAISRINQTIRESKSVGTVTPTALSLWVKDLKDDDKISLYETGIIKYDAATDQILYLHMDNPGVTPVVPITLAEFQDVATLATKMSGANLVTDVWASDVAGLTFTSYPSNTDTRLVDTQIVIDITSESLVFKGAASPKASGEFLFVDAAIGTVSVKSGRLRRLIPAQWEGLATLRALQVGPPTVVQVSGEMPQAGEGGGTAPLGG